MTPRIKPHVDRIGFKDYRSHLKIVLDGMPSKEICNLAFSKTFKRITIQDQVFELQEVSTVELSKYKKKLRDSALRFIE